MKKIYKYKLLPNTPVEIPWEHEILSVKVQNGYDIVMYAIVDTSTLLKTIEIKVIPTGGEIDDSDLEFIDTVQLDNGLVFHVFKNKYF